MTFAEWESSAYVERLVDSWHIDTERYPSKNEAIRLLELDKQYRQGTLKFPVTKRKFNFQAYAIFLIDELIKRIRSSEETDPIRIICQFMDYMDDMVTESNNKRTWVFAGLMRDAARDILEHL